MLRRIVDKMAVTGRTRRMANPATTSRSDARRDVTSADVAAWLRDRIRLGRVAPGQRLIEADVVRDTGASRGRVREALQRLETEGLIVIEEFRGASVRSFTPDETRQIYRARMALEEGHEPFGLDPETLEPRGYQAFGGKVTAHPKEDPVTKDLVFFGYADAPMPFSPNVSYGVMGADGVLKRRDTFQAPYCSMIHDFMVTGSHVLFPILPLSGSMERAMKGLPPFAWEPEKPAMVGVMARDAAVDSIRWFQTEACYVFHVMNAWDEDGKIVADVMKYAVAPLFPLADGSRGQQAGAYLVRWTFDLNDASDVIREEQLDDLAGEFPRYDERFTFKANRHGWFSTQSAKPGDIRTNGLSHIDLTSGKRIDWVSGAGDAVSEPVFVPRSADAPE
eukprot:gene39020-52718_t